MTMVLALAVVPALFKGIVVCNMTGSATHLTVGSPGPILVVDGLHEPGLDADEHAPP